MAAEPRTIESIARDEFDNLLGVVGRMRGRIASVDGKTARDSGVHVLSLVPRDVEQVGRTTPARFRGLTRELGADLAEHRSKMAQRAMINDADAIFVMDAHNWLLMRGSFPDALEKTYLLGLFADDGGEAIEDPYMLEYREARHSYRRLRDALDALWRTMIERREEPAAPAPDKAP